MCVFFFYCRGKPCFYSHTPVVRCSLPWLYVTISGNNIYYTNNRTDRITSCDMNGKVQWECYDNNLLVSPRDITTDKNNNIYVVGQGSNIVVVISPDGQSHKVVLSDREYLHDPWGFIVTEQVISCC